ncbi:uncharacterized protein LOC108676931 [Hyalella azteca]|uniref:Uncharacterized protein LOC108676931 n=1 Tax=Hyalella azteca TaxID=294128 RepID=A0A979FVR4_HYAAZ|nr:uncharacterized protein LOC108676931 [Hyalella azteca]
MILPIVYEPPLEDEEITTEDEFGTGLSRNDGMEILEEDFIHPEDLAVDNGNNVDQYLGYTYYEGEQRKRKNDEIKDGYRAQGSQLNTNHLMYRFIRRQQYFASLFIPGDRQPRKLVQNLPLRGFARHKQANKKLYPQKKKKPTRHPDDIDRFFFVLDDYDPIEELPEPTSLPWIQLASLGTFITGITVYLAQLLLDINQKPNLPIPFGINRFGRDLRHQDESRNTSIDDFDETVNGVMHPACRPQMLCETRQLITYVPAFERIVQTYGVSLKGLGDDYEQALQNGAARRSCQQEPPVCTSSFVTWLLEATKAFDRLWTTDQENLNRTRTNAKKRKRPVIERLRA